MPKLIKLNKYGTLALTIPKSIVDATNLKAGDLIKIEIKNTTPLVLKLEKLEGESKW
jgi:antitoxin component of MazEF toxin-antitoxin module